MGLFDVHAHLTHPELLSEVPALIERAKHAGLTSIISNGLGPEDNEAVLELSRREAIVRPALGLYPVNAVLPEMRAAGVPYPDAEACPSGEDAVAWLESHIDEAFAVGEVGLDGYWVPPAFWDLQERHFRRLVRLAKKSERVLIIHSRKREARTLEILEEEGITRVNWHCFGGKLNVAKRAAERGHCFSIPANSRRSETFTRMLASFPREQLLLETDCPYLSPDKARRSEPADVASTAAYAAELWQVPDASAQFMENYARLFGCEA